MTPCPPSVEVTVEGVVPADAQDPRMSAKTKREESVTRDYLFAPFTMIFLALGKK